MGQVDIILTVVQTGSVLNGTMFDTLLNWINTNLKNNLPSGWTLTTPISMKLGQSSQFSVTITISQANITLNGTLLDQALAWINTNIVGKLPSNYSITAGILTLTP